MFDMFFILFFIVLMLAVSYAIEKFFWHKDLGPCNVIKNLIIFGGVALHELSHFTMALLVGVKPMSMKVKLRGKYGQVSPHGSVSFDGHQKTFLQMVLMGLAPLIVSTWLLFFLLDIVFSEQFREMHFLGIFLIFYLIGCTFIAATPSKQDFLNMGTAFKKDPRYSIYQTFLLFLSGLIVWAIVLFFEMELWIDIFYYVMVGLGYYGLKYTIRGVDYMLYHVSRREISPKEKNYSRFKRRRFKPSPPRKLGRREAPW